MSTLAIVLLSAMGTITLVAVAVAVGKSLKRWQAPKPCYRCAAVATTSYMGLEYCFMCRVVVLQMIGAVRHDPPFGFPGATGYVDWPQEEKKEETHG